MILAAVGQAGRRSSDAVAAVGCFILILLLYLIIVMCMFIVKMWTAIQDGHARTTPGKALGFGFIPFFNFYWVFVIFPGFAQDFNNLVDRYSLTARKLPVGLYNTYAILCIVSIVPFLGWLAMLGNLFVAPIMIAKTCDAVNALPDNYQLTHAEAIPDSAQHAAMVSSTGKISKAAVVGIVIAVAFGLLMIIGIMAAIAIPSFLEAKGRANQKSTMNDMRAISQGLQIFQVNHGALPEQNGDPKKNAQFIHCLDELGYLTHLSVTDQWRNPLRVYCGEACNGQYGLSGCGPDDYLVISYGKDGEQDFWQFDKRNRESGIYWDRGVRAYENDLVVWNGTWIRKPGSVR